MNDMSLVEDVALIDVASVVFREDLYPRINSSAETVQKYAEDLDVLPAIEVNQHNELIDGWHRWTAHRKNKAEKIRARITPTQSDAELLELAIERNATHGLQLSQADKEKMAGRLYKAFLINRPSKDECAAYKERLVKILGATERSVQRWTSRDDKDHERELEDVAFDMWLRCEKQELIADEVGWSQPKVTDFITKRQMAVSDKPSSPEYTRANHAEEAFKTPIYNIWKQQEKTSGSSHFGNSEVRWLDNLLYLYTKPFDVVIDPFAGGGSTVDLCKKRFRRYWVSDRKPIVEREKDIRQHDLTEGLPPLPRWKDVSLVYLDPPYWLQAAGEYSEDPTDLANMNLAQFNETLAGVINGFSKKLSNAYIALIIQPTQWKAPERQFTDHVGDMLRAVKLPVDMRFSVPYESQQCNAQMVDWAKDNKRCLVLTREIVVWRVA